MPAEPHTFPVPIACQARLVAAAVHAMATGRIPDTSLEVACPAHGVPAGERCYFVPACRLHPPRALIGYACRREAGHDGECDFRSASRKGHGPPPPEMSLTFPASAVDMCRQSIEEGPAVYLAPDGDGTLDPDRRDPQGPADPIGYVVGIGPATGPDGTAGAWVAPTQAGLWKALALPFLFERDTIRGPRR